ncbi:LacI family DNA-binding transcriptional regulator [Streptomyces sp. NPDC004539]|uniref:LacI family DNA-binding transcriptional regulator n=1 Tax=Streptomyces sp. NPDC004539 TaxID=3154280 RepID=UPI0033ACF15F
MGYAEKRSGYFRGRYKIAPGKYGTVSDESGRVIKFSTKREAKKAADAEELKIEQKTWKSPSTGLETFGEYVNRWYEDQDLADKTMENYRDVIECHLLPEFGDLALKAIEAKLVIAWERKLKEARYENSSIATYRSRLHLILGDAVEAGLIDANPAARRRGRGRRAGRVQYRGAEKVITTSLGILLVSERMAVLSGRDDEFVAGVLKGFTGIRWGELVGLEKEFVRPATMTVRIEWQLVELNSGELVRAAPKDDSYRTVDIPQWLCVLVVDFLARKQPKPCPCHGETYVFDSFGTVRRWGRGGGPTAKDVAKLAGVSTGTVSNVLNHPETVAVETRLRVTSAMEELDYIRGRTPEETAAHWRRTFGTRIFYPATHGTYPPKKEGRSTGQTAAKPDRRGDLVPILADPYMPGTLLEGRGAAKRATACWLPITPGLTGHGLRHTHRSIMEERGTPKVLMDDRLGHMDGSVSARYAHVTDHMRHELMVMLTEQWEAALDARLAMSPRSSVSVLDALLRARAAELEQR